MDSSSKFITKAWLERVIIYGMNTAPKTVVVETGKNQSSQLQFTYDPTNKVLLIRRPGVNINSDWSIIIN